MKIGVAQSAPSGSCSLLCATFFQSATVCPLWRPWFVRFALVVTVGRVKNGRRGQEGHRVMHNFRVILKPLRTLGCGAGPMLPGDSII